MREGWSERTLGEVTLKIGSGATPRGGKSVYVDSGTAFIRSQNVYDGSFVADSIARINGDAAQQLEGVSVRDGDVLICITGESVTRTCLVPPAILPARVSQHVAIVRPDPHQLDSRYLLSALLHPPVKAHLNQLSEAGATRRALTKGHLASTMVSLPPLPEQRRIAAVLGALDDLIDTNQRLVHSLDQLFNNMWASKFCNTVEAGDIALSELCKAQYGYTSAASSDSTGPHLLRVADINKQNWVDWSGVPYADVAPEDVAKYRLSKGDIVVARMADPGKSARIDDDQHAVFASYLVRLLPNDPSHGLFVYGFLKSEAYRTYSQSAMTGSVQKNMNARVIAAARLSLPRDADLVAFNSNAEPLRDEIASLLSENRQLRTTRDELLPLLMSGAVSPGDVTVAS